jgi:hypothetical protein
MRKTMQKKSIKPFFNTESRAIESTPTSGVRIPKESNLHIPPYCSQIHKNGMADLKYINIKHHCPIRHTTRTTPVF